MSFTNFEEEDRWELGDAIEISLDPDDEDDEEDDDEPAEDVDTADG